MAKSGLVERQERFCREYIVDYNGTRAAQRAGYSAKTAKVQASQLLSKPEILSRIRELQKKACESLAITPEYVTQQAVEGLKRCMQAEEVLLYNSDTKEYEPSGEWKFDSRGAARFLEILANTTGAVKNKIDLSDITLNITRRGFEDEH